MNEQDPIPSTGPRAEPASQAARQPGDLCPGHFCRWLPDRVACRLEHCPRRAGYLLSPRAQVGETFGRKAQLGLAVKRKRSQSAGTALEALREPDQFLQETAQSARTNF